MPITHSIQTFPEEGHQISVLTREKSEKRIGLSRSRKRIECQSTTSFTNAASYGNPSSSKKCILTPSN